MNWTGLDRIHDVDPLGDQDAVLFDDIRAVLERHGAVDRFGLCLLHSHFDMEDGEVLVERVDADDRSMKTSVEAATDLDQDQLLPTTWRLDGGSVREVQYCYRPKNSTLHAC